METLSGPKIADGFDRATFHGLFAGGLLFGSGRLLFDVAIASVIITGEILRGGFPAKIAIDTLIIDEIFTSDVVRIAVGEFGPMYSGLRRS